MTRDAFEILVSEWLDAPQSAELAAAIRRAIAEQPELGTLHDEWLRADGLLRRGAASRLECVRWSALRSRILKRVDAVVEPSERADGDELEASLTKATALPAGVSWDKQRRRIAAAIDRETGTLCRDQRLRRLPALASAALGLAASMLLVLALRSSAPELNAAAAGRAIVQIESGIDLRPGGGGALGVARVEVEQVEEAAPSVPSAPQILLIIDAPGDSAGDVLTISRLDGALTDSEVAG